jgi:hypothetical protein
MDRYVVSQILIASTQQMNVVFACSLAALNENVCRRDSAVICFLFVIEHILCWALVIAGELNVFVSARHVHSLPESQFSELHTRYTTEPSVCTAVNWSLYQILRRPLPRGALRILRILVDTRRIHILVDLFSVNMPNVSCRIGLVE